MPHLDCVNAITLLRQMENSNTKPYLMTCLHETGTQSEFIVKLHSQLSSGILGEFWCAMLGNLLGMPMPTTAIVEVDRSLGAHNPDFLDALSVGGPHFGSEQIAPGPLTPYDGVFSFPSAHFVAAVEIFAFDMLTQNPDRRKDNPNLYFNQDRFWMIDHELALGFGRIIGPVQLPWEIPLKDHIVMTPIGWTQKR